MTKVNESLLKKIQNLLNTTTENGSTESEAQNAILLAQKLMAKNGLEMADIEANANDTSTKKEIIEGKGTDGVKLAWWHKDLARILADNFRCYFFLRSGPGYSNVVFLGLKEDVEIAKSIFHFASIQIEFHARKYRKNRKKELQQELMPSDFKNYTLEQVVEYAKSVGVSPYFIDGLFLRVKDEAQQRKQLTTEIKKNVGASIDGVALRNDYIKGFLSGLKEKFKEQVKENAEEWGLILVKDGDVVQRYENISKNFTTARASTVSSSGDNAAYSAGKKQGKQFSNISGQLN